MKFPRRILLIVMGLAMMAGLAVGPAGAGSAGICERAVFACLSDPMNGSPWGTVYCVEGYVFCKLYVEPYINPLG